MKTYIFITIWVGAIGLAIFFGLSHITVMQTQHQKQTQNQVQRQDNVQLVFADMTIKTTDVGWRIYKVDTKEEVKDFLDINLNYYQQIQAKVVWKHHEYVVFYPEFNVETKVHTNFNTSENSNSTKIEVKFLQSTP